MSSKDTIPMPHGDILVIDDTPANLRLLTSILKEDGHQVRPATDGDMALLSAFAKPPDLILLDIRMPGMDGFEVCRRLKASEETCNIPVIFISGLGEPMDKAKAFGLGGVDYILKPFEAEEVLARVRTHLSIRMMQKQLEEQNLQLRNAGELLETRVEQRTKELSESEERFRSVTQSANDAIITIDDQGIIVSWNMSASKMFGREESEMLGNNLELIIPGAYLAAHNAAMEQLDSNNEPQHKWGITAEYEGLRSNGEVFPVEISRTSWVSGGKQFYSSFLRDISERKQAEERIRTLSQAIEQSPVSVMITDTDGNIEYVNSTFEKTSGYTDEEAIGQNPRILKSGKTPNGCYKELWRMIRSGKAWQGEFQNRRKDGDIYWEQAHIAPVMNESGTICHYLAVKQDITHRKHQEEEILHQAHFDALTDLPNRFLSLDRLSQLLNEARRASELVAVVFLDLDDFKKINDTLGHDTGDQLLIEAAQRLRNAVRGGDTVGRLGGDEFIILLGGLTGSSDASPVVENLINRFREPFNIDNRELRITASIGISIYPDDGNNPSELLRNADSAMYHSKEQGRNTYYYFTDAMNQEVSRRLLLEEQMHGALNRGEFRLCYQPLVAVGNGSIVGVEALLRWNNPALGEVSPVEFIPIAEQTGLIVPIGQFVLTEAFNMATSWHQRFKRLFTIAVNLSPRQFRDPDLVAFVTEAIRYSGISAESLVLEITEGVLMSSYTYVDDALAALNNLGVSIAMDDFGTGYSSLSYLRSYPFDTLKIDRSFINDVTVDPADRELVNATIAMAHGLGLKVVAEGVETEEQLALLTTLGCEFAQGYLFSKPVTAEKITEMLESENSG